MLFGLIKKPRPAAVTPMPGLPFSSGQLMPTMDDFFGNLGSQAAMPPQIAVPPQVSTRPDDTATVARPPAPRPPHKSGHGGEALRFLDNFFTGGAVQDALDGARAHPEEVAAARSRRALQMAELDKISKLPFEEQYAALHAPAELGKSYAGRQGVQNLAGGATALFGDPMAGGHTFTAPKMGEFEGTLYTQGPDGAARTGTLPRKITPDWADDGDGHWIDRNDPSNMAGAGTRPQPAARPAPQGPAYDRIETVARAGGATPAEVAYLRRAAEVESGGRNDARNGRSTGIFQFHSDTFAGVGGHDINDPDQQTQAALALSRRDRGNLQAIGQEPTDANLYIMHQQGAGGGRALLTAPADVGAVAALTPVYGSEKMARKAVVGNGGRADMSAGEFVNMWRDRWAGGEAGASGRPAAPGGRYIAKAQVAEDAPLSADAVDMGATRFAMTGVMPSLGMGKAAREDKVRIQNRASELIKQWGVQPEDWVTGVAQFKIAQGSLGKINLVRNQIEASEAAVVKNMDYVLGLAPKAKPGGVPFINRYAMAVKDRAFGDPDVKAYDNALHTVADEYAKVLTTTTGAGGAVLSDSARTEAYRRLSSAQTLPQLTASFAAIKTEMDNRRLALVAQEAAISDSLRHGLAPRAPGANLPEQPAPDAAPKMIRLTTGHTVPEATFRAAQAYKGSKAPVGSDDNPWMAGTEAAYNTIPSGRHQAYIDDEGVKRFKP